MTTPTTPGATAAGNTSRSMLRWTASTPARNSSTNANTACRSSSEQSSSRRYRTPRERAVSNSTAVFDGSAMPSTA